MKQDSEQTSSNPKSVVATQKQSWFRRSWVQIATRLDNPVIRKELRGRMRGRRAFVILTLYLIALSGFTSLLYYAYASAAQQPYGPDSYIIGKIVFGGVLGMQLLLVLFITPAFTAGAISSEKEKQTYDLLRTTLLSSRSFVAGKLVSAITYMVLLILAAVPLESMAFLLGGVAVEEIVISQLILLTTTAGLGAVSVYISSRTRNTLGATVLSYAFALLSTSGLPMLFLIISPILGIVGTNLMNPDELPWGLLVALVYGGGFLLAVNPISTIILSEVVLIEEQSLFFFKITIPSSMPTTLDIWLVSPWVIYVLFYLVITLLAFTLCVRRVRRVPR